MGAVRRRRTSAGCRGGAARGPRARRSPFAPTSRATGGHALYAEDWETCLALSRSAVQRFELAGDPRAVAMQLVFIADSYKELGAYEQAEPLFREAIATSSRMGLHTVTALAKLNLGIVLAFSGSTASAIIIEQEALAAYTEYGDHRLQICAKTYLAIILATSGDFAGAERFAREATETPCHSPPTRAFAYATLASVLLLLGGKPAEALDSVRVAMGTLKEIGHLEEGEALTRLAFAEALQATGDEDGARRAIADGRDRILARAASLRDPAIRQGFLTRVPSNAKTLTLAREWLGEPTARRGSG